MDTRHRSDILYPSGVKSEPDDDLSSENDPQDMLLHAEKSRAKQRKASSRHILRMAIPWTVHILSISLCIGLLAYAEYIVGQSRNNCVRKLHEYSPVLRAVDDDYDIIRFNGTIRASSPYKGPPTPAVLGAWASLTNYGSFRVTETDILRSGASLSSVKYPESVGGGYLAVSEGVHQQHCLFILWQDHYLSHLPDRMAIQSKDPQRYEDHYEHCVDYLRQKLACNFDTGFLPFSWVRGSLSPLPNFSTRHRCVNGGSVRDWLLEQGEAAPTWENWAAPKNAVWEDEA